jgi:hypothetical protein
METTNLGEMWQQCSDSYLLSTNKLVYKSTTKSQTCPETNTMKHKGNNINNDSTEESNPPRGCSNTEKGIGPARLTSSNFNAKRKDASLTAGSHGVSDT